MRSTALLLAGLLAIGLPAGADLALAPSCSSSFLPMGAQAVPVGPNAHLVASFTLAAAGPAVWGLRVAHPVDPVQGLPPGRILALAFLEDAQGNAVAAPQWTFTFPSGAHAVVGATKVDIPPTGDGCAGFVAYATANLAAGTYRVVAVDGSEMDAGVDALVPAPAPVQVAAAGPATLVSEATLACQARLRVDALAVWSTLLQGCSQTVPVAGRAYGGMAVGQRADGEHHVLLAGPAGMPTYDPVPDAFTLADGPNGTWDVEVPVYRSPLSGAYFGFPTMDAGVFGVIADVPALHGHRHAHGDADGSDGSDDGTGG